LIYLLITLAGVGLLITGLYLMTFGFGIPPNFGLFLLGLCMFVAGMLMLALFAGRIDLQSLKIETIQLPERKPPKKRKTIPKPVKRPRKSIMEKIKTEIKAEEEKPKKPPAESTAKSKIEKTPSKESLKAAGRPADKISRKPAPQENKKIKDANFVKERLHSLKKEYMENVKGADEIIEDRLSPFKGVLDKIKAESRSNIIWSFDASDVQDTMQDILKEADESIVIMYPWIRNLDVSILKKFMDTKSRIIIQEASLDDEASVELIRLLLNNNVDIRTMPHIHTIAAVADNKKGLIISTDPIYDSFEVGVIYNDKKSIKQIERLFEKAWSLSEKISIGG